MDHIKIAATKYAKDTLSESSYNDLYPRSDQTLGEVSEEDFVSGAKFATNLLLDRLSEELPYKLGRMIADDELAGWLKSRKI